MMEKAERVRKHLKAVGKLEAWAIKRMQEEMLNVLLYGSSVARIIKWKKEKPKMTKLEEAARNAVKNWNSLGAQYSLAAAIAALDQGDVVLVEQSKQSVPAPDRMTATEAREVGSGITMTPWPPPPQIAAGPGVIYFDDVVSEEQVRSRPEPELTEEQKRMGLRSRRFIDCPERNEDYD